MSIYTTCESLTPLTVHPAASPNPATVAASVTFTPNVLGDILPYTYQWQFEQDTLWDDLVAYWNLNEASGTRRDARGEIHLLPINTPGAVAGKGGNAATFDNASSQYLQSASQANISGANGITFTCWLNVRTGAPVIAQWFWNGATFISSIGLNTSNVTAKTVHFGLMNDAGESVSAGTTLAAYDTWYFVVGVYDPATQKPSISIDDGAFTVGGTALVQGDPNIEVGYGGGHVRVGALNATVVSKAYIDEVGLWSRVLTAGEITSLYAAGAGLFYPGSTEEIPVYAYPTAGAKVASLTVTSAHGCEASRSIRVVVS